MLMGLTFGFCLRGAKFGFRVLLMVGGLAVPCVVCLWGANLAVWFWLWGVRAYGGLTLPKQTP